MVYNASANKKENNIAAADNASTKQIWCSERLQNKSDL